MRMLLSIILQILRQTSKILPNWHIYAIWGQKYKKKCKYARKASFFSLVFRGRLRLYCLETRAKPIKKRAKMTRFLLYYELLFVDYFSAFLALRRAIAS